MKLPFIAKLTFEPELDPCCLSDMTIVLPRTLTRDLEKFDSRDFCAVPKWAILRNHTGLQVNFVVMKFVSFLTSGTIILGGKK